MLLQLAIQLILPSILLLSLWRACPKSRLEWLIHFLAILAAYFPIFLIARWDFTCYYFRYGFAVLLFVAGFRGYRKVTNLTAANTSQPHLHLHVERGGDPGKILTGEGVPFKLGGRFLVRNSLFTGN